ncbi:uncharacterized protein UTRI_05344_B [Ustilago trichophora]|uniref:Uncharacterized protein n=1 Tax=Ustilago trichophora TaxID=86804 RepID=A0A5C3EKH0_9BASI|nr:uncharacterized protein UTRI_05344_B [Ustilago trichophora]
MSRPYHTTSPNNEAHTLCPENDTRHSDIQLYTPMQDNTNPPSTITASLRTLLTALLLVRPPNLQPSQLSSDLQMRHRMLSLPSTSPLARDSVEVFDLISLDLSSFSNDDTDDETRQTQYEFVSYISRPPIELGIHENDIAATARSLFQKRMTVMQIALAGESDPIDPGEYELLCDEKWHGQGRMLVRFPECSSQSARLHMMVIWKDGEMRLDNLFSVDGREDVMGLMGEGCHRWSETCTERHGMGTKASVKREGEDQAAEYINDADDFWAGFSDEEEKIQEDSIQAARAANAHSAIQPHGAAPTDSEAAIKDIIRGAFTLHRFLHSNRSETAQVDAFMRLVSSAITRP